MSGMSKWQRKTQEEQRALGSQKSESENNEKQSCQSTHGHLTIMSILGPNMEGCKILVLVILFQIVWIDVSSSFEMKMLRCSMPTCLSGQKIITTRLSPRQSLSPRFSPIRLEMTDSSLSDDILNDDNDFTKMHDAGKLRQEAETLKARAKAIAAEARAMEKELKQSRYRHLKEKVTESDDLIQGLFPHSDSSSQTYSSFSPHTIAKKLRSQRWSPEQVLAVVDRIYERQTEAMGQSMQASPHEFQIGSIQNVEKRANVTEYEKLDDILDTLMKAVAILDTEVSDGKKNENKRWTGSVENALRTRMKELKRIQELNFKRETAKQINEVAISNESVEEYVRRTFVGQGEATDQDRADGNITDVLERVSLVPMWVPSSFLPFIINSKTSSLGPEEVEAIKEEVLLGSRFYVTRTESVPGAALFRGNIRTPRGGIDTDVCKNQTAMVFADIQHRLQQKILDNKIQLFLMPDPEWRPGRDERETEPKPVILALSKAITPDESKIETGTLVESGKVSM